MTRIVDLYDLEFIIIIREKNYITVLQRFTRSPSLCSLSNPSRIAALETYIPKTALLLTTSSPPLTLTSTKQVQEHATGLNPIIDLGTSRSEPSISLFPYKRCQRKTRKKKHIHLIFIKHPIFYIYKLGSQQRTLYLCYDTSYYPGKIRNFTKKQTSRDSGNGYGGTRAKYFLCKMMFSSLSQGDLEQHHLSCRHAEHIWRTM